MSIPTFEAVVKVYIRGIIDECLDERLQAMVDASVEKQLDDLRPDLEETWKNDIEAEVKSAIDEQDIDSKVEDEVERQLANQEPILTAEDFDELLDNHVNDEGSDFRLMLPDIIKEAVVDLLANVKDALELRR